MHFVQKHRKKEKEIIIIKYFPSSYLVVKNMKMKNMKDMNIFINIYKRNEENIAVLFACC